MLITRMGMSERVACRVTAMNRSTYRRKPQADTPQDPDRWLRDHLNAWVCIERNSRKGYRRAWADLRAEGHVINRKRVHRIWREEGLQVRHRRRHRKGKKRSTGMITADAMNVVWAADFQFDWTTGHRRIKIFSMVDEHTRESLIDLTDDSITAEDVVAALAAVIAVRGLPVALRLDNGPEFIADVLAEYCDKKLEIVFVPPGEPWRNGFIESFNSRVRDECLRQFEFHTLLQARVMIGDWKRGYNEFHRHSSLGYLTPLEYAGAIVKSCGLRI
jgi:putative transposase